MSGKEAIQADDGKGELLAPTPKIDLRNAGAIRRELAMVYRDMRAGRIESAHGTKLAYVLEHLRKAYETEILEKRLDQLEKVVNK